MTPTGTLVKQRRFGSSSAYLGFYEGAVLPGGLPSPAPTPKELGFTKAKPAPSRPSPGAERDLGADVGAPVVGTVDASA